MEHEFVGKHLIANYLGCSHAKMANIAGVYEAMEAGVLASGATVLGSSRHVFIGGGFSLVILLSESHVSIHTYPEVNSCFVDMFTCGNVCDPQKFGQVMRQYLEPKHIIHSMISRDDGGYLTQNPIRKDSNEQEANPERAGEEGQERPQEQQGHVSDGH